jgi:hypothetical protein
MLQGITYGTYILFGIITYLGAAFVYFFVPETKRLTLEEMVRAYPNRITHLMIVILTFNRTSSLAAKVPLVPTLSVWRRLTMRSVLPQWFTDLILMRL